MIVSAYADDVDYLAPSPGSEPQVFVDGFEQISNNGWRIGINNLGAIKALSDIEVEPNSLIHRVDYPVRGGTNALRMTVPHALGSFRTEVARPTVAMGSEYWYGFSIYLPVHWQVDQQTNILAQWHAVIGKKKVEGDGVKDNPPVALAVEGTNWVLKLHWNTTENASAGAGAGQETFTVSPIEPGHWINYVVHAKWSHGDDGFVQLWQDGSKKVDYKGPNEYVDKVGPYFKIGIYHPEWKSITPLQYAADTAATRAVEVVDDEIRIAPAPASYDDVAPRGQIRN